MNWLLKSDETVAKYVDDVEQLVRCLRQANGEMAEYAYASLPLSNTLNVFGEMTQQHTVWCSKNDRSTLKLSEAMQRLRTAEQARDQVKRLQTSAVAPKRQAAQVNHVNSGQKNKAR
ncbi:hypothetical protein PF005_g21028 [Phytophthora fragariae]|uniref:Uncharacterized protein n=1 Tax=Phytophthora fragariae TaxID=53985 RepID=A0A6A3IX90_9STRA|nr:hypothetical protein PF003_g3022 [Phytophthora fragariae]KAE8913315.1 hypothetical protein PF003_g3018 [Phytophthora fragariae]KAE8913501.1 hypothetical protein PF003_g3013 [Phytophthora fragariae]KAE8913686.1 hypothetical protein PF003_g3008 [Phytophthora fragariae]KAE8927852.1 hypothetical protein PF009_g21986 [Phytophthora fragariae]